MKKSVFYLAAIVFVGMVAFSIKLDVSKDLLEGCFVQETVFPSEKICLNEDGSFTQEQSNDSGSWVSITEDGHWQVYQTQDGIGLTLIGYRDVYENHGDLDLFPYKTVIGNVVFIAGPESSERRYLKD